MYIVIPWMMDYTWPLGEEEATLAFIEDTNCSWGIMLAKVVRKFRVGFAVIILEIPVLDTACSVILVKLALQINNGLNMLASIILDLVAGVREIPVQKRLRKVPIRREPTIGREREFGSTCRTGLKMQALKQPRAPVPAT